MKTATFSNTMDILVKAYLNDTLQHSNCYACAVGNLVASANGITFGRSSLIDNLVWNCNMPDWFINVRTLSDPYLKEFITEREIFNGKNQIESIGYTLEEVDKIEHAFESAPRGNSDDDWMFNGLLAVLEVVAQIHGVDLSQKKVYQDTLTEIYETA